jgi:hypothetical protein
MLREAATRERPMTNLSTGGHLRHALSLLTCVLAAACGTRPPPDDGGALATTPEIRVDTAASVTGRWSLERSPRPEEPTAVIRLELEIDSAPGGALFGRLASYLAGDVGIEPTVFPRFGGELTDPGRITIRIGHADTTISGFVLRGSVGSDTIPLDLFVVGPDTVSNGPWSWRLVRHPE